MNFLKRIYKRAAFCRAFEEEVARRAEAGQFKFPIYLSIGQEYIPATVATWLENNGVADRQVFIQHRGHSQYLCFGGDLDELVLELLGDARGCAGGMGGSASICSRARSIFGHDGLMGTQVPIAVGACYGNRKPTICFVGDAAAEEDYVLAALGWAATQKLPILFVVEDNNLSILTEKSVRRSWDVDAVARAFGLASVECSDDPQEMIDGPLKLPWPALLNVRTTRISWHAGHGVDNPNAFDRHADVAKRLDQKYVWEATVIAQRMVEAAWARHCAR